MLIRGPAVLSGGTECLNFKSSLVNKRNLQAGAAKIVAPLQIMASSLHDASLSCDPQPRSSAGHPKKGTPHEPRGEYYWIQTHHKLALQTTYGPIVPFLLPPPKLDPSNITKMFTHKTLPSDVAQVNKPGGIGGDANARGWFLKAWPLMTSSLYQFHDFTSCFLWSIDASHVFVDLCQATIRIVVQDDLDQS